MSRRRVRQEDHVTDLGQLLAESQRGEPLLLESQVRQAKMQLAQARWRLHVARRELRAMTTERDLYLATLASGAAGFIRAGLAKSLARELRRGRLDRAADLAIALAHLDEREGKKKHTAAA